MKKLLFALLLPFTAAWGQYPIYTMVPQNITENVNNQSNWRTTSGGVIQKNDTIRVTIKVNASSSGLRSTYFDFQHQFTAISLIDVTMATPGATGSALPANATTSVQNYFYPNCKLNRTSQNTTTDSWNNYYASTYTCNSGSVPNDAINRIFATVSGNTNLGTGDYMYLRFKITNVAAGFAYDSIRMNFAAGYQSDGNTLTSTLGSPHASWVTLAAGANNLITGKVSLPATALSTGLLPKVVVTDSLTNVIAATKQLSSDGLFSFSSELSTNSWYKFSLVWPTDSLVKLSTQATTLSDYTAAFQEFLTQNLDRTYKNNNLTRGVRYKAADVTRNSVFDGGDVQGFFNMYAGIDTVIKASSPVSVFVMPQAFYDTISTVKWNNSATVWSDHVSFKTSEVNQTLNLAYLLLGDDNLSHSSQITTGTSAGMSASVSTLNSIDVNLANAVVTSNNITIPFEIDTRGLKLSGLQFEIKYDASKVKFEKLMVDTQHWISFVTPTAGVLRFGSVDKDMKSPISGKFTPFKLQFSTVQSGVDINSAVVITPLYDAADSNGNQVAINLNTTIVKLIGANNFLKTP